MGKIRVLPEDVANKIAAGEVIERPASIVKELIENSLDAGADFLEISVHHGGKSLIRVADNGAGMTPEDAELALRRHATSKIKEVSDLNEISTFGFRGEALTSIAAVSRMTLLTRPADFDFATEISVEGGGIRSVRQSPASKGTVIEVRDLFFNTPARRKFLKSETAEMGHLTDAVQFLALANPSVRILLKTQDKVLFDLHPVETAMNRAQVVFGKGSPAHMLRVEAEANGIRISGFIGKPSVSRANRSGMIFFVNRRWVKSQALSFGLIGGYHGLLMQGQFPVGVIFLDLDLNRVDVNVHPTKQEVRISNEKEVKSLIRKTVAEHLGNAGDLSAEFSLPPGVTALKDPRPADFMGKGTPVATYADGLSFPGLGVSAAGRSVSEPLDFRFLSKESDREGAQSIAIKDALRITKILGQVHGTFIVAETQEGIAIIDQHAAHERINFEALLEGYQSGTPPKQRLLSEEIFEVSPRESESLMEAEELLRGIGYEIEAFGENTFVIRAYPAMLGEENVAGILKAFLEERESGKMKTRLEDVPEEIAALIACKRRSVKAHESLTFPQMEALLQQLARCRHPFSCPHGRPAFLKQSVADLEKQFRRK